MSKEIKQNAISALDAFLPKISSSQNLTEEEKTGLIESFVLKNLENGYLPYIMTSLQNSGEKDLAKQVSYIEAKNRIYTEAKNRIYTYESLSLRAELKPKTNGGDKGFIIQRAGQKLMLKQPKLTVEEEQKPEEEQQKTINRKMMSEAAGAALYANLSHDAYDTNKVTILTDIPADIEIKGAQLDLLSGNMVCVDMFQKFEPFLPNDKIQPDIGTQDGITVSYGLPSENGSRPKNGQPLPYINDQSKLVLDFKDEPFQREVSGYTEMLVVAKFLKDFDAVGFGSNAGINYVYKTVKIDTGNVFGPDTENGLVEINGKRYWTSQHNQIETDLRNKNLLYSLETDPADRCPSLTYEKIKANKDAYNAYCKQWMIIARTPLEELVEAAAKSIPKDFPGREEFLENELKPQLEARQNLVKEVYKDEIKRGERKYPDILREITKSAEPSGSEKPKLGRGTVRKVGSDVGSSSSRLTSSQGGEASPRTPKKSLLGRISRSFSRPSTPTNSSPRSQLRQDSSGSGSSSSNASPRIDVMPNQPPSPTLTDSYSSDREQTIEHARKGGGKGFLDMLEEERNNSKSKSPERQ